MGPYASKTDFAEVEHKYPAVPANRMALTPEILKKFNQEQVDQIMGASQRARFPTARMTATCSSRKASPAKTAFKKSRAD